MFICLLHILSLSLSVTATVSPSPIPILSPSPHHPFFHSYPPSLSSLSPPAPLFFTPLSLSFHFSITLPLYPSLSLFLSLYLHYLSLLVSSPSLSHPPMHSSTLCHSLTLPCVAPQPPPPNPNLQLPPLPPSLVTLGLVLLPLLPLALTLAPSSSYSSPSSSASPSNLSCPPRTFHFLLPLLLPLPPFPSLFPSHYHSPPLILSLLLNHPFSNSNLPNSLSPSLCHSLPLSLFIPPSLLLSRPTSSNSLYLSLHLPCYLFPPILLFVISSHSFPLLFSLSPLYLFLSPSLSPISAIHLLLPFLSLSLPNLSSLVPLFLSPSFPTQIL